LRAVGGATWQQSSSPIYYKFGILKINDMNIYKLAKLRHKLETEYLPIPFINHFVPVKLTSDQGIKET